MARSDLPFGSEFSPQQVGLPILLELAHSHDSDWQGFEMAVRNRYFASHDTFEYNQRKLANNAKSTMAAAFTPTILATDRIKVILDDDDLIRQGCP